MKLLESSSSRIGSMQLMYTVENCDIKGYRNRGYFVRTWVSGQQENDNLELVQSNSGLWAFSQSVPRIISWVPTFVT